MNSYDPKNYDFLNSTNRDRQRNPYLLVSRPKSLGIDTILPSALRDRTDDALYLISILIFKAAHGMVNANGYTNLNFDILAQIMDGRKLRKIKESLLANNVIECDGIWCPNEKSLGYRLHPRFSNDVAITSIIKNPRISRALDRYYVKKLAEMARWQPVHHELNKHQHMIEIEIDQANEIIEKLEPKVKRKSKAGTDPEIITRRTKLAQSSLCQSIHNKSNVLKVGTTDRVYNSVTSLSRELRPTLRHKGEQLESVDIRNSQPALLRKLVEDNLASGNGKNASHIGTRKPDAVNKAQVNREQDNKTPGHGTRTQEQGYRNQGYRNQVDRNQEDRNQEDSNQGYCNQGYSNQGYLYDLHFQDDFLLYSELTANGEFYNFMWEQVQLAGYRLPKEAIKAKFLTDIFAKKKVRLTKSGLIVAFDYDSVVEEVFQVLFPTVYQFICDTNKTDPANGVTIWKKHSVLI